MRIRVLQLSHETSIAINQGQTLAPDTCIFEEVFASFLVIVGVQYKIWLVRIGATEMSQRRLARLDVRLPYRGG